MKFASYEEEKRYYEEVADEKTFLDWYKNQDEGNYEKPSVTVDMVSFRFNTTVNKLQIMLVQRKRNPYRGKWALPGGFVEPNEDIESSLVREVKEETTMTINKNKIHRLPAVSTPGRDPRMWVITNPSIVMFNDDDKLKFKASDDANDVKFFNISINKEYEVEIEGLNKNDLAFDHYEIISDCMNKLRSFLNTSELSGVYELLPKKFIGKNLLNLAKSLDAKRFDKYTNSMIERLFKNNVKLIGKAKRTGSGPLPNLYSFK